MSRKTSLKEVLDFQLVKKQREQFLPMRIELKKSPVKGVGIYATSKIKDGEIVALYRLRVFRVETYRSITGNAYCFSTYTVSGNESRIFIGDLVPESLQDPLKLEDRYIPYWGYFSNEPSPGQVSNVWVDMNTEENYKSRKRLKEGDFITYKLVAIKDIAPGDEIVWHYGDSYHGRDYLVNSESQK